MYNFKYEIRLNDKGRPYIHLFDDHENRIEDRFMALEIARYVLYDLAENKRNTLPEHFVEELQKAGDVVGQLSDKLAELIRGQMDLMDSLKRDLLVFTDPIKTDVDKDFDIEIETLLGRDNIPIGKRTYGLKVLVSENQKIYMLIGGIGNNHWAELG